VHNSTDNTTKTRKCALNSNSCSR